MSDPTGRKGPVDLVFDLALYAPVGLAYSLADLLPALARRGRDRLEPQISLARSVGQFAVNQGARQARSVVEGLAGPAGPVLRGLTRTPGRFGRPRWPSPSGAPQTGVPGHQERARGAERAEHGPDHPSAPRVQPTGAAAAGGAVRAPHSTTSGPEHGQGHWGAAHAPSVEELAIPSYDSLSASQVVHRLAGLSREEVRAVRAYEAATRARRTIVARADQLLA